MPQVKQRQTRLKTRAPHGAPEFTERIALYATAQQKKAVKRRGYGSQWVRKAIDHAILIGLEP